MIENEFPEIPEFPELPEFIPEIPDFIPEILRILSAIDPAVVIDGTLAVV